MQQCSKKHRIVNITQQFNYTGIEYPDKLHKSLRNFKEALIIIKQEHRIIRIDKILLLERQVQQQSPGDCNNQRHVAHQREHNRRTYKNTHIPQRRIHLRSFLVARPPHQSKKLESCSKKNNCWLSQNLHIPILGTIFTV